MFTESRLFHFFLTKIKYLNQKFSRDLLWGGSSIITVGSIGVLINIIITYHYGLASLGIYNQVFSCWVLLSHLTILGIPQFILRQSSLYCSQPLKIQSLLISGITVSLLLSFLMCWVIYCHLDLIGPLFNNKDFALCVSYALPGLFFFTVDRVFLAVLNGLKEMRVLSLIQAVRYIFMLITLLHMILFSVSPLKIGLIFSVSEGLVFFFLCYYLFYLDKLTIFSKIASDNVYNTIKNMIVFGVKGFTGDLAVEYSAKINILLASFFLDGYSLGIYSFAMTLIDSIAQVSIIFRNVINSYIPRLVARNKIRYLEHILTEIIKKYYLISIILSLIITFSYILIIKVITGVAVDYDKFVIFCILLSGLLICSGYLPLVSLLLISGKPGSHLFLNLSFIVISVSSHYLLSCYHLMGAAIATSISYLILPIILFSLSYYGLGVKLSLIKADQS